MPAFPTTMPLALGFARVSTHASLKPPQSAEATAGATNSAPRATVSHASGDRARVLNATNWSPPSVGLLPARRADSRTSPELVQITVQARGSRGAAGAPPGSRCATQIGDD